MRKYFLYTIPQILQITIAKFMNKLTNAKIDSLKAIEWFIFKKFYELEHVFYLFQIWKHPVIVL